MDEFIITFFSRKGENAASLQILKLRLRGSALAVLEGDSRLALVKDLLTNPIFDPKLNRTFLPSDGKEWVKRLSWRYRTPYLWAEIEEV